MTSIITEIERDRLFLEWLKTKKEILAELPNPRTGGEDVSKRDTQDYQLLIDIAKDSKTPIWLLRILSTFTGNIGLRAKDTISALGTE